MLPSWRCQILTTLFCVGCDASDFAIGSALLQTDAAGRERVIAFESCQLKAAENNIQFVPKRYLL